MSKGLNLDDILKSFSFSQHLKTAGDEIGEEMNKYVKQAASDFYAAYSPHLYSRTYQILNVGEKLPTTPSGKYGVKCGAKASNANMSGGYIGYTHFGKVQTNHPISTEAIFSSVWGSGQHGVWYTAATSESGDSIAQNYQQILAGEIGGILSSNM